MNKIDKSLTQLTKKERGPKLTVRNEQEITIDITIDNKEIQNIIWEYFKDLNSIKLENLKEMDDFSMASETTKFKPRS